MRKPATVDKSFKLTSSHTARTRQLEKLDSVLPLYGSIEARLMKKKGSSDVRVRVTNRDRQKSIIVPFDMAMTQIPELRSAVEEFTKQGRYFTRYIVGHDKTRR
jgi:hypothetical protein